MLICTRTALRWTNNMSSIWTTVHFLNTTRSERAIGTTILHCKKCIENIWYKSNKFLQLLFVAYQFYEIRVGLDGLGVRWTGGEVYWGWAELGVRWTGSWIDWRWGELRVRWTGSWIDWRWGELGVRWTGGEVYWGWAELGVRWTGNWMDWELLLLLSFGLSSRAGPLIWAVNCFVPWGPKQFLGCVAPCRIAQSR